MILVWRKLKYCSGVSEKTQESLSLNKKSLNPKPLSKKQEHYPLNHDLHSYKYKYVGKHLWAQVSWKYTGFWCLWGRLVMTQNLDCHENRDSANYKRAIRLLIKETSNQWLTDSFTCLLKYLFIYWNTYLYIEIFILYLVLKIFVFVYLFTEIFIYLSKVLLICYLFLKRLICLFFIYLLKDLFTYLVSE